VEIGIYACLGGLVYLLGLFYLRRSGRSLVVYTLLALVTGCAGLVAFLGLSQWIGVQHFGQVASYNYPRDYLKQGLPGILVLLLSPLWMLSPLLLAYVIRRRDGNQT
jgi:hypothetical protein